MQGRSRRARAARSLRERGLRCSGGAPHRDDRQVLSAAVETNFQDHLRARLAANQRPRFRAGRAAWPLRTRLDTLTQFQDANANGQFDAGIDALLAEYDYTVRDDGKRTEAVERFWFDDNADGILDPHENRMTWIYDNLGRLTDEVFDHYDNSLDQTEHFVYDLVGNRLSQSVDRGNDGTVDETTSYQYDANDRLTEETSSTGRTTPYAYDHTQQTSKVVSQNGTLTGQTAYTYDLQGRRKTATVTSYTDGAASKVERTTYEYDARGIRVSAVLDVDADVDGQFETSTKTEYLNDPENPTGYSQVLKETVTDPANGQVQKTIVYTVGLDQITQTTVTYADGLPQSEETLLFSTDGHGSTRVLLNMLGALATVNGMRQLFHYDAFGNAVGFNVSLAATSFLYNNEQFDSLTGFSYLRARYYDAATGRFNRLDPFFGNLNDPQSLHKYLFCHGDGINFNDPSGRSWTLGQIGIAVSIAVGLSALAYYGFYRPLVAPMMLMMDARPVNQDRLNSIGVEIGKHWSDVPKMQVLSQRLKEGMLEVYALPPDHEIEGLNFKASRRLFISEPSLEHGDIAAALVIFAEFQHSAEGGSLGERQAQEEFARVRNMLPRRLRTAYIDSLHHGGTENDQ